LPNGLTLLLFENHHLPIVVADAVVKNSRLLEPEDKAGVATLTGYVLDEGTTKLAGREIAAVIEDVGGVLTLQPSGGVVKVLAPDQDLALQVLFQSLAHAEFSPEALNRQRERLLAEIDEAETQPDLRAELLYRKLAYGNHPLGRSPLGRRQTVEGLTVADCTAFYHRVFVPDNTLVAIVGDFDSKQVVETITRLTADWKKGLAGKPATPAVDKPKEFTQRVVSMPEAAQLHFYLGHAGIRRDNPDYYKLLVMDYVLGTGPGFTDRLSARMRDRQGLAYTVSANITSTAAEEPGLFTCYIGTDAKNFDRVKGMFLEELNRLRAEKPTEEEVGDVKKYLLGSLPFQFTTDERIAARLLEAERYHLGFAYLETFPKQVSAVTPADVQAVARAYLDPSRMVLVAAGPVNSAGKPLSKATRPNTGEKSGK
jgi:zinc protease